MRNKLYQGTQTLIVRFIAGFSLFMESADNKKNTDYHQLWPLSQNEVCKPVQLCHTSFIIQRLQIRQGSPTLSCALSNTHLQYVK